MFIHTRWIGHIKPTYITDTAIYNNTRVTDTDIVFFIVSLLEGFKVLNNNLGHAFTLVF